MRRTGRTCTPLRLTLALALGLWLAGCSGGTPPPVPRPDYFVGSAVIPPGQPNMGLLDPRITASSIVLLTVDTTMLFDAPRRVAGVKLNNVGDGFLTVTTLDLSEAPAQGLPFNYLVLNSTAFDLSLPSTSQKVSVTAGVGRMHQGQPNVGVDSRAVTASSLVFLTTSARNMQADSALPGLKVNNHGAGFFTVTTLDLSPAPAAFEFNYLIVNPPGGGAGDLTGTAVMSASSTLARVANPAVHPSSAIFLTVDATRFPADSKLPGVEVGLHGSGFFTAAT